MTEQQIKWARSHDWFVSDNGDGTITVADRWYDRNTQTRGEIIMPWLLSFRELREWAGY